MIGEWLITHHYGHYNLTFSSDLVKITVGASNALIPSYTAHHYPVYMRNLGIGAGNLAAGFALVLVPYLFLLVSDRF